MKRGIHFLPMLAITCIVWIIRCGFVSAQDATFTATVDNATVALDRQFTFVLSLSSSGLGTSRNLKPPDLGNFLVVSGPNQSTSMQLINGSVSSSQSYSYILQPRDIGKFTIGSATIELGGKEYRSQPVEITVIKSTGRNSQQPQGAQPADAALIGDNILLRASVDRTHVTRGEQVTITYKLYTRIGIMNIGLDRLPAVAGFWTEELPVSRQLSFSNEMLNGKQYRVAVVKKAALFPTQTGTLEISPMQLTCQVELQQRGRSGDIFDQFFGRSEVVNVPVICPALKITVQPLPVEGVPGSFKGAVGKYALNAALSKTDVKTNEPISLKATISGTGNIKLLEAPVLTVPKDIEMYEPKVSDNISRDNALVSGSKTFEWLLVPRYPGQKKIPPLEFSYFDALQKRYVTLRTNDFTMMVEKGSAEAPTISGGLTKDDVKMLNQDIRYIKSEPGAFRRRGGRIADPGLMALLALVPLSAFVLLLVSRRQAARDSADLVRFRSRHALKLAARRLKDADKLLKTNDAEAFYAEISRALWQYVSDKFSIDRAELSIDTVALRLREKNISAEFAARLLSSLESCEYARFAPASSSSEEKTKMYAMTSDIIVATEKELSS